MGRRPKPMAVLKLAKGRLYSDQRDRAELEPQPQRELIPRCPTRFSKEERKAWREIKLILDNYGLFTAANFFQICLLSTAWSQYCGVSGELSAIARKPGRAMPYGRKLKLQHRLGELVDRYCQNLGLSSMAMARIGSMVLKGRKQKSEMEELLD